MCIDDEHYFQSLAKYIVNIEIAEAYRYAHL